LDLTYLPGFGPWAIWGSCANPNAVGPAAGGKADAGWPLGRAGRSFKGAGEAAWSAATGLKLGGSGGDGAKEGESRDGEEVGENRFGDVRLFCLVGNESWEWASLLNEMLSA
jgi:hypothetical protein